MIVLIAEDNALLAFMIEEALSDSAYTVLGPVSRADTALSLAEDTRPDIALVDIDLEGELSGVHLAKELRARWSVATLFMTGQLAQARAHPEAALGVIAKPFSPATVVSAVNLLAGIRCREAGGELPPEVELFDHFVESRGDTGGGVVTPSWAGSEP